MLHGIKQNDRKSFSEWARRKLEISEMKMARHRAQGPSSMKRLSSQQEWWLRRQGQWSRKKTWKVWCPWSQVQNVCQERGGDWLHQVVLSAIIIMRPEM